MVELDTAPLCWPGRLKGRGPGVWAYPGLSGVPTGMDVEPDDRIAIRARR